MTAEAGHRQKTVRTTVTAAEAGQTVPELLARHSGISKGKIKDAMTKGAVWLSRAGRKAGRLRGVTHVVRAGDTVELHYDEEILALVPPAPDLIEDRTAYSVWWKPAGLMTQGSLFGDHASLLRIVEKQFGPRRTVFLVHRLDREASGLVLLAHTPETAARLSAFFQRNEIEKEYRAEILGLAGAPGEKGSIESPVDGKEARTDYEILETDVERGISIVRVFIRTGRKHQIRRHFQTIGHPVMGDPRYGEGNKNRSGLRLEAVALRFRCPLTGKPAEFVAPERN